MNKFFLVALLLQSVLCFAVPGDDCTTAISVNANGCSAAAAYNNTGITGTLTPPSCFTTGTNNGMWFSFVASTPTATITINGGTLANAQVAILSPPAGGCGGGTFTELGCAAPATGAAVLTYSALTVGNTYYIYVDGQQNQTGTFQLCLSSPLQPANDSPCNPFSVPATNFCSGTSAYTNVGGTADNFFSTTLPACWDASTNFHTVWFQFTPTGPYNTISVTGAAANGLVQPKVVVLTATAGCNGATWASGGASNCGLAAAGSNSVTINANNLTPGTTYLIGVDGAGGNTGAFQLCVNSYTPSNIPVNDQCSGAIFLCPNGYYTGTTAGATNTNDVDISQWSCNGNLDNTVWYYFKTTSPAQNINFNITTNNTGSNQGGGYIQFEVFDYTGGGSPCGNTTPYTSMGCVAFGPTGSSALSIPASSLQANHTYYLLIDNYPGDTCNFNFSISGNAGANAGADQSVCRFFPAFNLTGTPAGGTWSGPGITNAAAGTFDPSVSGYGSQTVFYTSGTCVDQKIVTVTGPQVVTSGNVNICQGQSANISGSINEFPATFIETFSNNITYAIPDGNATGVRSNITVSGVNPATFSANPAISVCLDIVHPNDGDLEIYLVCPGGAQIALSLQNGFLSANYTGTCFTPTATTAITAGTAPYTGSFVPQQAFSGLNGCNVNGTWQLWVSDQYLFDSGSLLDWSITFNDSLNYQSYSWSPTTNMTNATTLAPTVSPTATTTYTLTASDANGCTASSSVTVNVSTPPNVTIATPTILSCTNPSVTLTASSTTPGVSYAWSGGGTGPTKTVTSAGTYKVTVSLAGGCSVVDSVTVTQAAGVPNVNIAAPAPLTCTVTSVTLTASSTTPGVNYAWSGGGTNSTKVVTTPGPYTVTVTDPSNGCSTTATTTVTQTGAVPNVTIATPTPLTCAANSVTLTASSTTPGVTYAWSGGGTTNTKVVTNPGPYTVTVTDPISGCAASTNVTVVQNGAIPTASIATPATLTCANTSVTLTATTNATGATYSWSGGGATATNVVSAIGGYTVTVTDPSNGCTNTASTAVAQNITVPSASITLPGTLTCANTSVTLAASSNAGAATYAWSGGGTNATKPVTAPGGYTVTVTDPANGCTNTANTTVVQNIVAPNASIAAPATLTCAVTSVTLTASSTTAGATFNWGAGNTTTTNVVTAPNTYTVTVTDPSNGCTATANTTVNQTSLPPVVTIATPAQLTCVTNSVTLTASSTAAGATFDWGGGNTTNTSIVTAPATYSVTMTDPATGCTATTSATVVKNITPPAATIAKPAQLTCSAATVTLTVSSTVNGATYVWDGGSITNSETVSTPNTYSVTVTDPANGCTASYTATVIQAAPISGVSHTQVDVSCFNGNNGAINITVNGGQTPYSFVWSNGQITQNAVALVANTYTVIVTDANGCKAYDTATVAQPTLVQPTLTTTDATCNGSATGNIKVAVAGGTPAYTFAWNDGSALQNRDSILAGNYVVSVTDANHCIVTANTVVNQPSAITITPTAVNPSCIDIAADGSISITASGGGGSYQYAWSSGAINNTLSLLLPGSYTLTVTDNSGCTATRTIVLKYKYDFTVTALQTAVIAFGDQADLNYVINGNAGNYVGTWSPDSSLSCGVCQTPTAMPKTTTTYQINIKNDKGCKANDTVTIYVYDVFLPNVFTPNGDGNNDVLKAFGHFESITSVDFSVFNRWGEEVYQSHDVNFQWDGTYKGKLLDPDVFAWQMKLHFTDGHDEPIRKGSVTILR